MLSGDCNVCINGKMPSYSATCVECGLSRKNFKPITNADRFRAMTDEELMRRCEQFQYMPPPAWIPVTERLPEEDGFTLIFTAHGHAGVCYFTNGWWGGYGMDGITHWMPLPQPPKEET